MAQQATKEHILLKTIDAIEKYGLQNLTTRVIADEAGVNNAALHYYYGTKENLVEQALAQTIQHMLEDTGEILARSDSLDTRLYALFEYLIDGVLNFPNIIRAHIQGPLMEGIPDSPFMLMLDTWLASIYDELEPSASDEQKLNLRMAVYAAISTCLLTGLMPLGSQNGPWVDPHTKDGRAQFIQYLVGSILHYVSPAD
jgi:AcrR family transcriptional regulator